MGGEQAAYQSCQSATVGVRSECTLSVLGESCEGDHASALLINHATGARTKKTLHTAHCTEKPHHPALSLQCPLLLKLNTVLTVKEMLTGPLS